MKLFLIFLITWFISLSGIAREYETIKVSGDLELIKISDNAYVHVSYSELPEFGRFSSNGLIYIDSGKGYLFDTPMTDSMTKELVDWIVNSLDIEIVGFVPNHWHADCMGGLNYLHSIGIDSYAHQMTIDIAEAAGLPKPTYGFNDSLFLNLNDKPVECYYHGAAHSLDNIVVWIPDEGILFAGCMVKEYGARGLGNTGDGDLNEYPGTIDKVMARFPLAKIVIPGHGQVGGMELLRHTKELLTN